MTHAPGTNGGTRYLSLAGRGLVILSLVLCAMTLSGVAAGGGAATKAVSSWPHFRGHGAIGHAVQANPPLAWSIKEEKNVLWKAAVPKPGMSSPVVWGNRLFLTGGDDSSRQVYCYEADSGKLLWQHDATDIPGSPSKDEMPEVMETSGLAAPTATTNGRYVAAIFATGDLVCLDMDGKRAWAKNLGVPRNQYGHASSLVSDENLLFVQYDQEEGSKLLAFDLASGKLAWQVDRGAISWSSPLLIDNNGRRELVLTNCETAGSYDPATGKVLWTMKGLRGEVAPSAAYADGVVYVANEYSTAAAIRIGQGSEANVLWQWADVLPDVASPLANSDYLIMPSGFGAVVCLDARTGKVFWEHEFDKGFYSSPILVNDRVYLIDRSGVMQVFRMDDEFELLGTSATGEPVSATPAFVGDRIYIRGEAHLFCIEEHRSGVMSCLRNVVATHGVPASSNPAGCTSTPCSWTCATRSGAFAATPASPHSPC